MVLSTSTCCVGATLTCKLECESRAGISSNRRFQRLETQSGGVSAPVRKVGPLPDPSRCILSRLRKNSGVCFSSIYPNRPLFTTGTGAGGGSFSACGTSTGNPIMVSINIADEYRPAHTNPTILSTPEQRLYCIL